MKPNPNAEVLVLDENGTNLGRMPYRDAQALASSRSLDLVSVNKKDGVEVFKIMDYGKWKYEKKKHKQKKPSLPVKEMNFKMRIDPHDQEIKVKRIKSFLDKGADVKITVTMRGREKANPRLAHDKMDEILQSFGDTVQVQQRRGSPSAVFATIRPVEKKPGKKNERPDRHQRAERPEQSEAGRHGSDADNATNSSSGNKDAKDKQEGSQAQTKIIQRSAAVG